MNDDEVLGKNLKELIEIKRYMRFLARDSIVKELCKIATTPDRQQIWRLADGSLSNEQIAQKVSVTLRAVQYFVEDAENSGLIISEKRGYPKRIENIIPSDWKPWKAKDVPKKQIDSDSKKIPEG